MRHQNGPHIHTSSSSLVSLHEITTCFIVHHHTGISPTRYKAHKSSPLVIGGLLCVLNRKWDCLYDYNQQGSNHHSNICTIPIRHNVSCLLRWPATLLLASLSLPTTTQRACDKGVDFRTKLVCAPYFRINNLRVPDCSGWHRQQVIGDRWDICHCSKLRSTLLGFGQAWPM